MRSATWSAVTVAVAVVVLASLTVLADAAEKAATYTNKFDKIDLDRILANNRIFTGYIKCLLDEGPCTAEGRELKKLLPEALRTGCNKCTDTQRRLGEKAILFMMKNKRREWERLQAKYDSKGEFRKRYAAELARVSSRKAK